MNADLASEWSSSADELLTLLWQQASDHAFVLLNVTGHVIGWRGSADNMFGYTEAEAMGKPMSFIFTQEDRDRGIPALELSVASIDGRSEDDRWHVRKDGTEIWVSGALLPLRSHGKLVGFAKVMRDRTDLKAQIETLKSRADSTEQQLRDRASFFARVIHEVRNSLAPMRTASALIERAKDKAEMESPLAVIKRQVSLAERMMYDLADVARVSTGQLNLAQRCFDVHVALHQIAETCQGHANDKRQNLQVLTPPVPLMLHADPERFHQIIFNLLDNAIKYTPEGGRIWVKCTVEGAELAVRVQDTGVGIPAELLPRIFELFTQEEPSHSKGGFGVGLSLVKDLVSAHKGFVEVRSDGKGKGSEFTVRLPLGKVPD